MPFIFILVFLGSAFAQDPAAEYQEKWHQCTKKEDCVAVEDVCGSPKLINEKYRKEYYKYVDELRPVVMCKANLRADSWPTFFNLICKNGVCENSPEPVTRKPKNKELVRAETLCGSADTFYTEDDSLSYETLELLRWILHYSINEKQINMFDFGEQTGTYIPAKDLDSFLKRKDVQKTLPASLVSKLRKVREIRVEIAEFLKQPKIKKDRLNENPKARALADRLGRMKWPIVQELEKNFSVKYKDTGADCD